MGFKLMVGGIGLWLIAGCGCATSRGSEPSVVAVNEIAEPNDGTFKLTIHVSQYHPHCGGIAPTPEMKENMTQPGRGQLYYLYELPRPENRDDFTKVIANHEGVIEIRLEPGTYGMITEDKMLPYDEFLAQNKVEKLYYQNRSDTCFEEWRNRADFGVELSSDTTQSIKIVRQCYTGINPCIRYTGPYKP